MNGEGQTLTAPAPTLRGRAAAARWAAGTALVVLAVLVVVLLGGGGAPQRAPDASPGAGSLTGWALPVVRLAADLLGLATLGLLLAAALLLPSPAGRLGVVPTRLVGLAVRTTGGWLSAVAVEALFTVSDLLDASPGDVLEPAILRSFLTQTAQGRGLLVQAALVVAVGVAGRSAVTSRGATVATVVALGALAPPTLTGHSGAASHELALAGLLVHVSAASLWVGGLAALAAAAVAGSDGLRHAVPRFSTLALWCFAAVAASGVVNAAVALDGVAPLVTSAYGVLVLAKVAALVVLGRFGWWQRRRVVVALANQADDPVGRRGAARAFLRVSAAELVVMGATVALAVGLSRTPVPAGDAARGSSTAELLGLDLPPAPTVARLLLGLAPDGFALAFLMLAAALYGAGVLALRRRGDGWPVGRTVSFGAGLLVFAWATVGGLGRYAHVLFSAHMVAHMLLSMVVPIGLVLGAPVTLALRTLPGPRVPGELGPRQLLLGVLHSRAARVLLHPLVAFGLFVGSVYAVYFTGIFPALMTHQLGHVVMEVHFLSVGFLFFFVLVGIDPAPTRVPSIARVGLLFAAMPFHAFFSIAVMSSDTVLAGDYFAALHRPYATDLLADQHLGGGIGWALGELPVLLVLGAVFVQWARSDAREAARFDRNIDRSVERSARLAAGAGGGGAGGGGEGGGDELSRYNGYLAALARRDAHRERQTDR